MIIFFKQANVVLNHVNCKLRIVSLIDIMSDILSFNDERQSLCLMLRLVLRILFRNGECCVLQPQLLCIITLYKVSYYQEIITNCLLPREYLEIITLLLLLSQNFPKCIKCIDICPPEISC